MRRGPVLRFGLIAGLALWLSGAPGPLAAAEAFLSGIDDMPLMSGLAQIEGRSSVFDSPSGRIVELYARGRTTRERVMSFYATTLPQLGWEIVAPGIFRREGEVLHIEFPGRAASSGGLTVRFYLVPG